MEKLEAVVGVGCDVIDMKSVVVEAKCVRGEWELTVVVESRTRRESSHYPPIDALAD